MRQFFYINFIIFFLFSSTTFSSVYDTIYSTKDSIQIKEIEDILFNQIGLNRYSDLKNRNIKLEKAYKISKSLHHIKYIAIIEEIYSDIKDNEESDKTETLEYTLKAIDSYKALNDSVYFPNIVNLYVRVLEINTKFSDIYERKLFLDSLDFYFKKFKNKKQKYVAILSIGRIYLALNKPKLAQNYIKEIDQIRSGVRDSVLNVIRLRLHEHIFTFDKDYNKALIYNDSTIMQSAIITDVSFIMYDYFRRGNLLTMKKDFSEALSYYNKSYQIAQNTNNLKYQTLCLFEMATVLFKVTNYELAQKYAKQSFDIALKDNMHMDALKNSLLLYKIDSIQKDNITAIIHLKNYIKFRDSLFPVLYDAPVNATNYLEIIRIKNQNNALENENTKKDVLLKSETVIRRILWVATFIAILLSLFMFYYYFSYKNQTKLLIAQKNQIIDKNTELREKNENLEKLYQEKNDLISIVSHDLKAPLNRAKALADLIQMSAANFTSEQKMLFEKLTNELADERNLITEIFNSELLDIELNSLELTPLELNELLANTIDINKVAARTKEIQLDLFHYADKLFVNVHEAYFKRIIDNLISNAIKFSERRKKIEVFLDVYDNNVYIHIKDQGQGFTEADQTDLFKKYHKLSSKPTEGESSTGLGLSIVKRLVTIMKGTISLSSKKGIGSTFTISFPKINI